MTLLTILFFCLDQTPPSADDLSSVVIKSFTAHHDGYSSDEVLLNDELNQKFIADCQKQLPGVEVLRFNWTLINLRKAGKLSHIKTTKRNRKSPSEFRVLAEIVARSLLDTEKVSLDRIFANPRSRKAFDEKALELNADADLYLVRKAAFQLRKARRLKPELITRIADWGRKIVDFKISEFRNNPTIVPESPGIYIFRDSTGYLYIGQSGNLRERLVNHLDDSSNSELASYLDKSKLKNGSIEIHSFPADSQAKNTVVRRAYESELIRSRKPKYNILP